MKNKKESRKRRSSDSSGSSASSSSSNSSRSRSKSPAKRSKHTKRSSSGRRGPPKEDRDVKSKWDSPDERIDRRRAPRRDDRRDESKSTSRHDRHPRDGHQDRTNRNHRDNRDTREPKDRDNRRDNRPERPRHRSRSRSRSRQDNRNQRQKNRRSRSKSFDHSKAVWGKAEQNQKKVPDEPPKEKEKPNFALSGKLTEETNTYKGVVIKYSEPPEARKPKRRWRLYPFKGEKAMQTLYIHRESAYLIGRDRKVVDIPVDHPSCSKQHAALQYRLVPFTRANGSAGKRVRPYLIDLESANGTLINNKKIEPKKYIELLERDVIKFGFSSREYVVLHENSKDEAQDDDVEEVAAEPAPAETTETLA